MRGGRLFRPRLVSPSRDAAGREAAQAERFRLVMLPHLDAAYSFARYLTRDSVAAEDAVQDAFLRAFRGFDGWRGDNPRAWLFAIVRQRCLDAMTARRDPLPGAEPVEAIDRDSAVAAAEPGALEDQAARRSEIAMLRGAIESLPEPFREALVLRELEELSYKDIATVTGAPIGTVMSRLARARQMLATLLLPPVSRKAQA